MKKALLLLLVILFLGAWIGEKMVQDPGYVLVSYNSTTI
jgi:HemY protein